MSSAIIKSIKIQLGSVEAELTTDEARALKMALDEIFEPAVKVTTIPVPTQQPYPYPVPVWPDRWRRGPWVTWESGPAISRARYESTGTVLLSLNS